MMDIIFIVATIAIVILGFILYKDFIDNYPK